jgi:hypothetical protein
MTLTKGGRVDPLLFRILSAKISFADHSYDERMSCIDLQTGMLNHSPQSIAT